MMPSVSRALVVAAGILASRLAGLVRTAATANFLGVGPAADVLTVALRAPNLIQNLLGDQALSASFIPVYSRLLADGRREEAGRLAGAVLGLVLVLASAVALLGVVLARPIVTIAAPGFVVEGVDPTGIDRFELAVQAVRIVFPMTALLTVAAWALAVLNSHRRFLVPYLAPVAWNAAIIAALVLAARRGATLEGFVLAACWGGLLGGALQLVVQLPGVAGSLRGFRLALSLQVEGVRTVVRAFGPSVAGRGVVQLSSYFDIFLASLLASGAVAALQYAQLLYLLPIALFGTAVAAAELPELARVGTATGDTAPLVARLRAALVQAVGLAVPATVGLMIFGGDVVSLLLGRGRFDAASARLVAVALAIAAVGIVPTVLSRLLQNTYWALGDTSFPAKVAALRVVVGGIVAAATMFTFDRYLVTDLPLLAPLPGPSGLRLGTCGLVLGSAVAALVELPVLGFGLSRRLHREILPWAAFARSLVLALLAAATAFGVGVALDGMQNLVRAVCVLSAYAVVWLGLAAATREPALASWLGRIGRVF